MNDLDERIQNLLERIDQAEDDPTALMYELANAYQEAGRSDDEIATLRRAVDYQRKNNGERSDDTVIALRHLQFAFERYDRQKDAAAIRDKLIKMYAYALPNDDPRLIELLVDNLQSIRRVAEDYELRSQHTIMYRVFNLDHSIFKRSDAFGAARISLLILKENELWRQAAEFGEKFLELARQIFGDESGQVRMLRADLASIYVRLLDDAEIRARLAKLYSDIYPDETRETIELLIDKQRLLAARKKELLDLEEFLYARVFDNALDQVVVEVINRDEETDLSEIIEQTEWQMAALNKEIESQDAIDSETDDEEFEKASEIEDAAEDGEIDSEYLKNVGINAFRTLDTLADIQRQAGLFELEIANRRRAVELYYEIFGEPGTWTVRIMVGAHMIVDELAATLERLGRVDELSEVNAMLADIDRMIADYQNMSPEQACEEIRKMLAD